VDGVEIKMVLYLPRDAASVPISRQVLNGCLETLGVTPDTRTDIALALSEACANVIQHAGPGDEYEVLASARRGRCVIEVVNTSDFAQPGRGAADRGALDGDGGERDRLHGGGDGDGDGGLPFAAPEEPLSPIAEHGRGLKIIDAVVDNVRLSSNDRRGTVVHFEKALDWVPGAAGEHLFSANTDH
jgi:serine/threonine-protein kinase RsbW